MAISVFSLWLTEGEDKRFDEIWVFYQFGTWSKLDWSYLNPNLHTHTHLLSDRASPTNTCHCESSLQIISLHLRQASTWPSTFLPFISTDGASHWSNLDATPTPPQPFSLSLYRAPAQWPRSAEFQEQCLSDHHCSPTPLLLVCVEGQWLSECVCVCSHCLSSSQTEVWLDRYGNLDLRWIPAAGFWR